MFDNQVVESTVVPSNGSVFSSSEGTYIIRIPIGQDFGSILVEKKIKLSFNIELHSSKFNDNSATTLRLSNETGAHGLFKQITLNSAATNDTLQMIQNYDAIASQIGNLMNSRQEDLLERTLDYRRNFKPQPVGFEKFTIPNAFIDQNDKSSLRREYRNVGLIQQYHNNYQVNSHNLSYSSEKFSHETYEVVLELDSGLFKGVQNIPQSVTGGLVLELQLNNAKELMYTPASYDVIGTGFGSEVPESSTPFHMYEVGNVIEGQPDHDSVLLSNTDVKIKDVKLHYTSIKDMEATSSVLSADSTKRSKQSEATVLAYEEMILFRNNISKSFNATSNFVVADDCDLFMYVFRDKAAANKIYSDPYLPYPVRLKDFEILLNGQRISYQKKLTPFELLGVSAEAFAANQPGQFYFGDFMTQALYAFSFDSLHSGIPLKGKALTTRFDLQGLQYWTTNPNVENGSGTKHLSDAYGVGSGFYYKKVDNCTFDSVSRFAVLNYENSNMLSIPELSGQQLYDAVYKNTKIKSLEQPDVFRRSGPF